MKETTGWSLSILGLAPYFEVRIHSNSSFVVEILRNENSSRRKEKRPKVWQSRDGNLTKRIVEGCNLRNYVPSIQFSTNVITFRVSYLSANFLEKIPREQSETLSFATDFAQKPEFLSTKKQVKAHSLRLILSGTNGLSIFRLKNY